MCSFHFFLIFPHFSTANSDCVATLAISRKWHRQRPETRFEHGLANMFGDLNPNFFSFDAPNPVQGHEVELRTVTNTDTFGVRCVTWFVVSLHLASYPRMCDCYELCSPPVFRNPENTGCKAPGTVGFGPKISMTQSVRSFKITMASLSLPNVCSNTPAVYMFVCVNQLVHINWHIQDIKMCLML